MEDQIKQYIRLGIEQEVLREFESLKTKMLEDLERRKNEICAGILISVMERVNIERSGNEVMFTIREIK